ncbi:MAG: ornithine carbamoyltransferase, partial [Tenericutes bacterium]|nr:ornithine carbamoyltransferase [Mycoplasmatota bacterium]
MKNNFYGRNFITLLDYSKEEIQDLLYVSAKLKAKKKANVECRPLKGKNVVLLFEKDSTRTRCA